MDKCYVTATIKGKAEHAEDLRKAMLENIPLVRAEEGCERYHLLVSQEDPSTFLMDEVWSSLSALQKHSVAPHMQAHKERTAHMLRCPTEVTLWHGVDVG